MLIGIVAIIWYGNARHDWTRTQAELATLLILVPFWLLWRFIERIAWNRNLRQAGISSSENVWDTNQLPGKVG
jgi:hypothetical protein